MKTSVKKFQSGFVVLLFILVFSLAACGEMGDSSYEVKALSDSLGSPSMTGAIPPNSSNKQLGRQFIRTADIRFKVTNVVSSTNYIEEIVRRRGGFIINTELKTEVTGLHTVQVSADSSLESTHYQVTNNMVLRIPNQHLDSALQEISSAVLHLDFRNIKAEDVALQLLSNDLTQKRLTRNANRVEADIDNKGKKLNESTVAEELLIRRQEQADAAGIANLSLNDQISFSTVKLEIYERAAVRREVISIDPDLEPYEPSFGIKLRESFIAGWKVLEAILVFLPRTWGILLMMLLAYVFYIRTRLNGRTKGVFTHQTK